MPSVAMSAPGAPQISAEDIKQQHPEADLGAAKTDIAAILSGSSDRAARIDAAKELVDIVKAEGPHAFVREGLADAILSGLANKKAAGK
ncbi:hypothetical protein JCM6882_005746 [Rhodosporidiobolus microsporus]